MLLSWLPYLLLAFMPIAPAWAQAGSEPLLWFAGGRPTAKAGQAVHALRSAADHGLEPRDYDAQALEQELAQAAHGPAPAEPVQAALDAALTAVLPLDTGGP